MTSLAAERNIRFTVTYAPVCILGDVLRLQELFFNVIHNAIKFSNPGGVVEVGVTSGGVVTVRDYGVGIPAGVLPHVCERLYTLDTARDERGVRGTGLGLSIASRIAEAHHATIRIDSVEGEGTTVSIAFPKTS